MGFSWSPQKITKITSHNILVLTWFPKCNHTAMDVSVACCFLMHVEKKLRCQCSSTKETPETRNPGMPSKTRVYCNYYVFHAFKGSPRHLRHAHFFLISYSPRREAGDQLVAKFFFAKRQKKFRWPARMYLSDVMNGIYLYTVQSDISTSVGFCSHQLAILNMMILGTM